LISRQDEKGGRIPAFFCVPASEGETSAPGKSTAGKKRFEISLMLA
jgi:hypothetical protein